MEDDEEKSFLMNNVFSFHSEEFVINLVVLLISFVHFVNRPMKIC